MFLRLAYESVEEDVGRDVTRIFHAVVGLVEDVHVAESLELDDFWRAISCDGAGDVHLSLQYVEFLGKESAMTRLCKKVDVYL